MRENRNEVQSATDATTRERELNSFSIFTAIVLLGAVTMTFGAMIAVFIYRSEAGSFWGHLRIPGVLWATTAILLASSATFELGRKRLLRHDQRGFFRLTVWTAVLGLLFLAGQIAAWLQIIHSGIVLRRNPHTWFIFLFSGLHGLHIVLGLAALGYMLIRTRVPASGPKYQMSTRAAASGVAVFWHYLTFLWILLFGLLLVWRR